MKVELLNNDRQLRIIEASEMELKQSFLHFTKKIKNAYFHPLVKKKLWDGNINFIDNNLRLSSGLWNELVLMCEDYSYDLEIVGKERLTDKDFNEEKFKNWVNTFFVGSKIQPRDYQIDAALKILKWKRSISEIATSAGKTLIMFMVFAYLKDQGVIGSLTEDGVKRSFLIIVPNLSLILQTYEEFLDYNEFKNDFKFTAQTFGGGSSKVKRDTDVIIGTFQTLRDLPIEHFKSVTVIATDECLSPDTKVTMSDNTKKCIKDVVVGDRVLTLNETTGDIEEDEVIKIHHNLSISEKMFEIELENGEIIKITGNHKVKLSTGEWRRVDELSINDEIFSIN